MWAHVIAPSCGVVAQRFSPGRKAGCHNKRSLKLSPRDLTLFGQSVGKFQPKDAVKNSGNFGGKPLRGRELYMNNKLKCEPDSLIRQTRGKDQKNSPPGFRTNRKTALKNCQFCTC